MVMLMIMAALSFSINMLMLLFITAACCSTYSLSLFIVVVCSAHQLSPDPFRKQTIIVCFITLFFISSIFQLVRNI